MTEFLIVLFLILVVWYFFAVKTVRNLILAISFTTLGALTFKPLSQLLEEEKVKAKLTPSQSERALQMCLSKGTFTINGRVFCDRLFEGTRIEIRFVDPSDLL